MSSRQSGRHDVRLDAAHQVGFYPALPTVLTSPLLVDPSVVCRRGEARRVNSEVRLDGLERAGAQLNKRQQMLGQLVAGKIVQRAVEVWRAVDEALPPCRLHVGCEAAGRNTAVDFVGHGEQFHRERCAGAASSGWRWFLVDGVAQVSQQQQEAVFLVLLGKVIARPVLGIRRARGCGTLC